MKTKTFILILNFLSLTTLLAGQQGPMFEGSVTYVNKNNVYVKFKSTESLNEGDTLYSNQLGQWKPVLIVYKKSSISCITHTLGEISIKAGDTISYKEKKKETSKTEAEVVVPIKPDVITSQDDHEINLEQKKETRKQRINGRLSISTNASIHAQDNTVQRMRASFSLNIDNISNSRLSTQVYVTYRHRYGLDQIPTEFYDDFKVFSLAGTYTINDRNTIAFGRKINNRVANMGAIDGIQFEHKQKQFILGAFAGTRPDFTNYTFNSNLMQWGGYVAHEKEIGKGLSQTTLSLADQRINFKTDRRFLYFQHSNSIIKNVNIFWSAELDLFQNIDSIPKNTLNLTSTYFSIRVKPIKKLSINVSYDNRRNIIYYESNRLLVDQLLSQETRQGLRFQANYNISRYINAGGSVFLRYQGNGSPPTKNYVANLSITKIPGINAMLNLNYNVLETQYLTGNIYGARINRDISKGRLNLELNYRKVDYVFSNTEQKLVQDILGLSATINIARLSSIMLSYEGTFEPSNIYHRYFITAMQRIRSK